MQFGNRNNDTQILAQALANRRKPVSGGSVVLTPTQKTTNDNTLGNAGDLLSLGGNLLNGLGKSGLFQNSSSDGLGIFGSAANDYINEKPDYGIFGNAANDSIMGNAGSGSAVGDAINSEVGSGMGSMSPMGWLSIGQGVFNGLNQGFNHEGDDILGGFGNGVQGFFGVNEKDSDVMQGIKGTVDGAMKGTAIFPGVGTIVGGLLGLGSSFLDDI